MKKKIFMCLVVGLLLSICMAVFTACVDKPANKIIIDQQVATKVEFGSYITIPTAHAVDENNQPIDDEVDITVVNPYGIIVTTSAMDIKAKILGNYRITYSYRDAEVVSYTVSVQDTVGPTIKAKDIVYNPYLNEEVMLFDIEMEDLSDIDYENTTTKVYFKETGEEYTLTQMRTFFPDKTGVYVYSVSAVDSIGNQTVKEWEFQVYDRTFIAADATNMTLASFDTPEYINVFGTGTVTDRAGNVNVEILDEYDGVNGVAKVEMEYFNHNFGYYSGFHIRFPRNYTYTENTRLAIKLKIEESTFESKTINVYKYEYTHHPIYGQLWAGQCFAKEGEWTTIIINNAVLAQLAEEDGTIKGLQLDIKRGDKFVDAMSQTLYIASITEIEQLSSPSNVRVSNGKLLWDAVVNASGYMLSVNGEQVKIEDKTVTEYTLPNGGYTVKIKAVGDGVYFEDSMYGEEKTNRLAKPSNLALVNGNLQWNAVENAKGYLVEINGVETQVEQAIIVWDKPQNTNYIVKVKAKGDGEAWYDSEQAGIAIRYLEQAEGYIADFSDELSEFDVFNMNVINDGLYPALDYSAQYLSEYQGATGVLKIKMTAGIQTWAVVALKLPETLKIDVALTSITIKFRIEGIDEGPYKGLRIYGRDQYAQARDLCSPLDDQIGEWFSVTIPQSAIIKGFGGSDSADYILFGVALLAPETEISLYLDEITESRMKTLSVPQNLKMENGTLTWDVVQDATGYVVTVNGVENQVTTNSFTLTSNTGCVVTVRATATGYIDSEETDSITNILSAPTGLTYLNGALTWTAVDGVSDYVVKINDTEYNVSSATSHLFTPKEGQNYVIKVKAKGDGVSYDSAYGKGIAIRGKEIPLGYIADFSDETYEYDFINIVGANLIEAHYAADELTTEYMDSYEGANGVVKVGIKYNSDLRGSASLKLPSVLKYSSDTEKVIVKLRIEAEYMCNQLRISAYRDNGALGGNSMPITVVEQANEWLTVEMDRSMLDSGIGDSSEVSYLIFSALNAGEGAHGTFIYVYLDEITVVNGEVIRAQYKEELASKLSDGQVALFNDPKYLSFLRYDTGVTNFSAEIVDDVKGEKGKVLHISATCAGYSRMYLDLPKEISKTYFGLEYRLVNKTANGAYPVFAPMFYNPLSAAPYSWDYGTADISADEWTTITLTTANYKGQSHICIGLQNLSTFDLYISLVYERDTYNV